MLSYTIRRLSQPKARGFLYRNSSFGIKRYSKEQEETKTPFNDITREEEARFLDLRPKNPFLKTPEKVNITGKEIENSILYNSFIDSFVDKAPFMKRVVKWRELELKNKIRNKKELLTKHVDSLVISKLSSPSIETSNTLESEECSQENADLVNRFPFDSFTPINQKYSRFQKRQLEKQTILDDDFDYGTSNPDIPISKIPCGGCGALLHCQNTSVPGYLPSEIFSGKTKHELRGKICQRCRFLREHNVALNVQIKPEDYPKVLSVIQDKIAIVILVVDLLDFPCSIWPGLLDIIGLKRPVLVVGNKVDLLPKDSPGYLDGIKKSLMQSLEQSDLKRANVKDVCLVSATTGYGVEQLITKIQSTWGFRGDAYLMGCTNVGKSSLFNALIQSDLCKTQAVDLLERATVSPWPGTTLNLLKFPLLRPTGTRLTDRIQRLMAESQVRAAEQEERRMQLKKSRRPEHATLIGHIGQTFGVNKDGMEKADPFAIRADKVPTDNDAFNPNNKQFKDSKWCFDTPGTVNHDQILTLLTLEELVLTMSNKLIQPRTLLFRPGTSYFLGGLARIDYLQGPHPLLLTTFASHSLPLTLVAYEKADELYSQLLGSRLLAVPCGDEERLKLWPGLSTAREISFEGAGWKRSAIDVVLSSAGWVAVTGEEKMQYDLRVYTPECRGIHVRNPPLLPCAVNLKGRRSQGSLAHSHRRLFV